MKLIVWSVGLPEQLAFSVMLVPGTHTCKQECVTCVSESQLMSCLESICGVMVSHGCGCM